MPAPTRRALMGGLALLAGCAPRPQDIAAHWAARRAATRRQLLQPAHASASAAREDPAVRDLMQAQQELLAGGEGAGTRAVTLYRRAAARRNATAEYNLGFCYETGLGVPVDADEAASWYRKAGANPRDAGVRKLATASLTALAQTADAEDR
jgi:TPR repeat protein